MCVGGDVGLGTGVAVGATLVGLGMAVAVGGDLVGLGLGVVDSVGSGLVCSFVGESSTSTFATTLASGAGVSAV